jgi:hypothetical protein
VNINMGVMAGMAVGQAHLLDDVISLVGCSTKDCRPLIGLSFTD